MLCAPQWDITQRDAHMPIRFSHVQRAKPVSRSPSAVQKHTCLLTVGQVSEWRLHTVLTVSVMQNYAQSAVCVLCIKWNFTIVNGLLHHKIIGL